MLSRDDVKCWMVDATQSGEQMLAELCRVYLAVLDAPIGRIDFHCDYEDGVEVCEFSPHGTRARAKKLTGQTVRLVRDGGG